MRVHSLLASAAVIAIVAATSSAHAQTQPAGAAADATPTDEVVVTGVRASLRSAQALKQNATTIVDSIVAQDIGKLPDVNVTEALQRITGVQIARDYGEGSSVTIRGLTQVETTLNGREAFTAGAGRTFNFQDVAAELVAGIDVYKTSQANLVEGGIGGSIDVRTHKPFDFAGFTASASARARYNDNVEKTTPLVSGLISDRWNTNWGEMGLLVAATYQDRKFRSDGNTTGAPTLRSDYKDAAGNPLPPVYAPNGTYDPIVVGERKRTGVTADFQWRPTQNLELYAEYDYNRFQNFENQHGINIPTNGLTPVNGSMSTFDGTNIVSKASYLNVPITTFGVARDTQDVENTFAVGGKWTNDRLTVMTDISYIKSTNDLRYAELDLKTTAPSVTQDLTTDIPSFTVNGVDLTNLANYNIGNMTLSENHYKGSEFAWTGDARYDFETDWLKSIQVGARYADRKAHFYPIRLLQPPTTLTNASAFSQYFAPTPTPDFWDKGGVNFVFPTDYYASISDQLRNQFEEIRGAIGVPPVPAINPLSLFDIGEKTWAGYAMANYDVNLGLRVDGNLGVRVVKTEETLVGFIPEIVGGVATGKFLPLNLDNEYTDVLPSFNARVHLTDQFQARFAASKTVTRPDFNQLSPSINLVPGQNLASGGNPNLVPLKSKNLDASLEYYFTPTTSLYVAGFYRKVQGFISNVATPGVIFDGVPYTLTQPVNGKDGTIKGVEAGYQQFFDFLPGLLSGFGVQANYTYVDSQAPSPLAQLSSVTLPNLSRNSYNLVGIYEKGPLSMRVAYNHRSKFYSGLSFLAGGAGVTPTYRAGYGWLDASVSYDVNDHFTVTLEGSNLLRTKTQTYYGTPLQPNGWLYDDRQITLGVRAHW